MWNDRLDPTRRELIVIGALVVGAVLASVTTHPLAQRPVAQAASLFTPYSVIMVESVESSSGMTRPGATLTEAWRSDGAHVSRTEHFPAQGRMNSQRFISFASGLRIEVDDIAELKSSTIRADYDVRRSARDPSSDCLDSLSGRPITAGQVLEERATINGYPSVKIRVGPVTLWFAPDLGCAKLQQLGDFGTSKSRAFPIMIRPGEPDPALFEVPTHYREVAPSELFGIAGHPEAAARDAYYFSHRPPK
ncbi:MAG: hypothetical protein AB1806_04650 [Acidobacteriota bacterium]